jgi:hypothetical protein
LKCCPSAVFLSLKREVHICMPYIFLQFVGSLSPLCYSLRPESSHKLSLAATPGHQAFGEVFTLLIVVYRSV